MPEAPKFMTPVEPADVAQMAMIEALRSIADGQKQVVKSLEGMQGEVREQAKMLLDVRERVVRIEAASVDQKLEQVNRRLDSHASDIKTLREAEDKRSGAFQFAETIRRWAPAIVAVIFVIVMFLRSTGRLGLR